MAVMLKGMCNQSHSDFPGRVVGVVTGDIIQAVLVPVEINESFAIK